MTIRNLDYLFEPASVALIGASTQAGSIGACWRTTCSATGQGLGVYLMRRIIDYARGRGIGEIYGDVLRENDTMLKVCRMFGFSQSDVPDEPNQVRVTLKLN